MAFPSTLILDSGVGTDADPIGGSWTGSAVGDGQGLRRLSNQIAKQTAGGSGAASWATVFTRSVEVFYDFAVAGNVSLYWHVDNPAIGAFSGYSVQANDTLDLMSLRRWDSGSSTILVGDTSVTIANGDSIGASHTPDGTITAWRKTGGVWSSVFTFVDTTYSQGQFVVEMNDSTARLTNFGGGIAAFPVVATPPHVIYLRRNF